MFVLTLLIRYRHGALDEEGGHPNGRAGGRLPGPDIPMRTRSFATIIAGLEQAGACALVAVGQRGAEGGAVRTPSAKSAW